ncbi:MAG: hypothetical protein JXB24_07965 [Bacteroidales bacterium]|nr:hypothetical protein [Bacteroidales bacterium]
MMESIETGIHIGNKSIEFIDTVIEKIEKYQKIKQDITAYLRLLYLEIDNNLEVFKTINFESFVNTKVNDDKVKTILKLLRTDMAESIFYKSKDSSNTQLYDKLKKKGKVDNKAQELVRTTPKGTEVKANKSFLYENILQAISFVVTKIEVMNKYAVLSDKELDILKPVRIKSRLININQRLLMIQKVMGNFDEIKEMAR